MINKPYSRASLGGSVDGKVRTPDMFSSFEQRLVKLQL